MAPAKPKVRDDLTVVELDGEAVVYDETDHKLHHLNPTGTIIFKLCDGQSTVQEMAEDISAAFEVEPADVELQIKAMLREFRKQRFFPGPAATTRSRSARTNGSKPKIRAKAAKKR